jgi:hypothetical protein
MAVVVLGVAALGLSALARLGTAAITAARADAAADAAAHAAALARRNGAQAAAACGRARHIAAAHGAVVERCRAGRHRARVVVRIGRVCRPGVAEIVPDGGVR